MAIPFGSKLLSAPTLPTISYADAAPKTPPRTPNCYTTDRAAPGQYAPGLVRPVSVVAWHTFHGEANGTVEMCTGNSAAWSVARDFSKPSRKASAHFVIAPEYALVLANLVTDRTWTTGGWNPYAIGIEMDERSSGSQCADTIKIAVNLAWWLSEVFDVQPMVAVKPNGTVDLDDIPRFTGTGILTWRGHAFHAQQVGGDRGRGDPGPAFAKAFLESGAEGFDARANQDRQVWKDRQRQLGMSPADQDGIPGPRTVAAMRAKLGRRTWVTRKGSTADVSSGGGMGALVALLVLGAYALSR